MPAYSLADPVVSVFVTLPVLLSGLFAWGVYCVATNGESRTVTSAEQMVRSESTIRLRAGGSRDS